MGCAEHEPQAPPNLVRWNLFAYFLLCFARAKERHCRSPQQSAGETACEGRIRVHSEAPARDGCKWAWVCRTGPAEPLLQYIFFYFRMIYCISVREMHVLRQPLSDSLRQMQDAVWQSCLSS